MVIPLNASSVYLSWTAPTAFSLSHYTVYYSKIIDNVLLTINVSNSSNSLIITGLIANSTQYMFGISINIGGFKGPFIKAGI